MDSKFHSPTYHDAMAHGIATKNYHNNVCVMCSFFSPQVGIIGGTGLDDPDILSNRIEKHVETPYGQVS